MRITKISIKQTFSDLFGSFASWRISYLIGIGDIRKRYARSRIGQFWLTLSLAIHIAAIGLIWSFLFKVSTKEYLPYFAVGYVFWVYISSCITDGSNIYITSASYLRELNISKFSYINSLLIKNFVILVHNIPVIAVLFLFCKQPIELANIATCLCGFIMTTIFLYSVTVVLSILSLRFRDFPNIILSLINIAIYATPIMWKIEFLPVKFQNYLLLNPFAVFISLCRNPILNLEIPNLYWVVGAIYIVLSLLIAILSFAKFHKRITYWL